ncbi:efflux RND transporter periplasmic adaptor subunit [Sediminicoccus rosea]|jgi:RND family efflux transporter MFP subunit|uniref:Efflux RND transporter periplasmic adaptor subunit n=1 Tax=Sediminicoccus rosea TaxID=1225128 RepID=A0ABZ0PFZ3_9PROT|nr:efflux RND transporter periplasmic adaptor subunit [Sediminicoccus rosea]WPB84527.1 efflux RND transporter periplasmic adaptor subunit [Sediminicoccus rosea]
MIRRHASLLLITGALLGCKEDNTFVPPPPPQVTAATPAVAPATEYLEATGSTVAVSVIDLVARVPGFLRSIDYADGAVVRSGQRLFQIEPDQYRAKVQQAEAQVQQNQALLDRANSELARQQRLIGQNATAQADLERWQSQRDQAQATLGEAQANLALARINLGYTDVTAPFDGVAGAHMVDVGALVGASTPTRLATLVQLSPIHVNFSVNERDLLRIRRELDGRGIRRPDQLGDNAPPVQIALAGDSQFRIGGRLDYIAPQLDPATGTLQLRGLFANADQTLLPGLFVRVRVPIRTRPDALMVPEAALGSNQLGSYLMVVGANSTIEQRPVMLGQRIGTLRVIEEGLKPEDQVVISGLQRAIPGARVTVQRGTIAPPPAEPVTGTVANPVPAAPSAPAPAPAAAPAR